MPFGMVAAFFVGTVPVAFLMSWPGAQSPPLARPLRDVLLVAGFMLPYVAAFVVALGARLRRRVGWSAAFGLRAFQAPRGLLLAVGGALAARVLSVGILVVGIDMGFEPPGLNQVIQDFPDNTLGVIALVLLTVLLAPVVEEMLFRGALYPALRGMWGESPGAVVGATGVSAGAFALMHVDPWVIVPTFLIGLLLVWLYEDSRSLWVPIICHATFNATGVGAFLLLRSLGYA